MSAERELVRGELAESARERQESPGMQPDDDGSPGHLVFTLIVVGDIVLHVADHEWVGPLRGLDSLRERVASAQGRAVAAAADDLAALQAAARAAHAWPCAGPAEPCGVAGVVMCVK